MSTPYFYAGGLTFEVTKAGRLIVSDGDTRHEVQPGDALVLVSLLAKWLGLVSSS